jgi:hypothetical protein
MVYSIVTNCLGGRLNLDSEPGTGDENPDHSAASGTGSESRSEFREPALKRLPTVATCMHALFMAIAEDYAS